jgi:hypothetical protein
VNQVFNGAYLCLLYGAVMRLATPYLLDVDGAAGAAVDYVHWSGVPLVFIVGYSFKYGLARGRRTVLATRSCPCARLACPPPPPPLLLTSNGSIISCSLSASLHTVELWRVQINSWLIRRLRFFDVADNPALIHELGLAELLHVCPCRRKLTVPKVWLIFIFEFI